MVHQGQWDVSTGALFPDADAAFMLAGFLRDHADELAADVVASFREYGAQTGSVSPVSTEQNLAWALEGILSMADQLERGCVDPAQYESFSVGGGDRYGELFNPLSYFVASRLHMSHVIAPRVWDAFMADRGTMERLLACLELYTQHSITANTQTFLAEMNQPRAIRRYWRMGERPAELAMGQVQAGRPDGSDDALPWLTGRERQIVDLVAQGKSNGEIAGLLGIRLNTVKGHMQRIFDKLGAASRTEVALIALRGR